MRAQRGFSAHALQAASHFNKGTSIENIRVIDMDTKVRVAGTPTSGTNTDKGLFFKGGIQAANGAFQGVAVFLGFQGEVIFSGYTDNIIDWLNRSTGYKRTGSKKHVFIGYILRNQADTFLKGRQWAALDESE